MDFGERLKEARLRKNWTQDGLGETVGKSAGAISDYEAGKRTPRIGVLIRLADALDVSVDYLLGREVHDGDLPVELRELFVLAHEAGHVGDLKDFFRWLRDKKNQLEHRPTTTDPDTELYALIPELTEEQVGELFTKFDGEIFQRMVDLPDEQKETFSKRVAEILYYLELERKVKEGGALLEAETERD